MTAEYNKGSEWLNTIFNKIPFSNDLQKLWDSEEYSKHYRTDHDTIDISKYGPFFETIEDDIYKFYELMEYGCNHLWMYWPYNKEIEDNLIKLGLISGRNRNTRWYNDLTEIKYEYDYEPGYMGTLMNTFGNYNKCYYDEDSIRFYHFTYNSNCQSFGGIVLFVDRLHHDIYIFGIGEDDGWMFPETTWYHDYKKSGINKYELWQLCAMINDVHVDNFDHQLIIEKLYNEYTKYENKNI